MNSYELAPFDKARSTTSYQFAKSIGKVLRHDEKVGKGRVAERETNHVITHAEWREGGGVIPRTYGHTTLVRRITDDDYEFFGATSRHGVLL